MYDIREHWTAVSTLLGLISSVYCNLHYWLSNQQPQIAVLKLYNWATSSYCTQVTPNQLVGTAICGWYPVVEIMVYTADET